MFESDCEGSAGDKRFLLPWADPRYVLFSIRQGRDRELVLVIADTSSGAILRQIGRFPSLFHAERPLVLGYGSFMAFHHGSEIRVMNLVTGELLQEVLGEHDSGFIMNAIHLTPDRRMILSTSCDGTSRFWPLGPAVADSPERALGVIRQSS